MDKLFKSKMLPICIAAFMLLNMSFQSVYATDVIEWVSNEGMESVEETDAYYATLYDEDGIVKENGTRLIVKYFDADGLKVTNEKKTYINPLLDVITINSEDNVNSYIEELTSNNENIEYIQMDYRLSLFNTSELNGALESAGESNNVSDGENIADDISSPAREIVVAVIDSGVDTEHEALSNNIWYNPNELSDSIDGDLNGYIDDVSGWDFVANSPLCYAENQIVDYNHGTHVAGIIAGESDNLQGVCTGAKIMPLKAFKDGSAYTSDVIRAIDYAENMGASVVNCSFGSDDENIALRDVIAESSMMFVCAAGNRAKNLEDTPVYPASYNLDNIISVAAIDNKNNLAYFSNYGENIDIAANGCSINSSVPENEYGKSSGTSVATAYISGVVANIMMTSEDLTSLSIKEQLLGCAVDSVVIDNEPSNIRAINLANNVMSVSEVTDNESDVSYISSLNANLREINQIAAGGYHSSVLIGDMVYSWGCNDKNQTSGMYYFGEGDFAAPGNKIFSHEADNFKIEKISTRGDHTLILLSDGTVRSYGSNSYGQLGIGYVGGDGITDATEPTEQVTGLTNIIDIAAGQQFSLALDASGRVYAWGNNKDAQVGNGNTYAFFYAPQRVSNLTDVISISAGHYHALAQTSDGSVYGWGRASGSALGEQSEEKCYTPVLLDIADVSKVVAGWDNSFFIKNDKTVYAFGSNTYGQLGDGTVSARTECTQVAIDNVIDISSNTSTIFLKEDGSVYGCGSNAYGQLGIGTTATAVREITLIPGTYSAISAGGNHTLLLKDDEIYACGRNHKMQCGYNNIDSDYLTPTVIDVFLKDSFTVDDVTVNYESNEVELTGTCVFGEVAAIMYAGNAYTDYSSNSYSHSVQISPTEEIYTIRCALHSPIDGINGGWIMLNDYPYKIYYTFDFDVTKSNMFSDTEITMDEGSSYILAVTVDNMENIDNKIFTVDYDNTILSLDDACVQTWEKDIQSGNVADTDIQIISTSNSKLQFKVKRTITPLSGTVNIIRFNAVANGTTQITVTVTE